jgi:DNA-directed RNA polymerase subunit M/transcription elongation factor TFIIS
MRREVYCSVDDFPILQKKKGRTSSSVKLLEAQDENIAVAAQACNSAKPQNAPKAYSADTKDQETKQDTRTTSKEISHNQKAPIKSARHYSASSQQKYRQQRESSFTRKYNFKL